MRRRHGGWPSWASYCLLCIGFALYFCASPLSSLGMITLSNAANDWQIVLWARVLFLVAGVCAIWRTGDWRTGGVRLASRRKAVLPAACAAVCTLAFCALALGGTSAPYMWNIWCYAILLGCGLGGLMGGWTQRFNAICQRHGRLSCVVAFSSAFIVSTAVSVLAEIALTRPFASVLLTAGCALTGCALYAATRGLVKPAAEQDSPESAPESEERHFRLGRYIGIVALSLGVTWSIAFNIAPTLGFGTSQGGAGATALILLVYAACQVAIVALSWMAGIEKASFSLMLRWVIAIIAACWSLMPAFVMGSPTVGCLISVILFLIESVVVGLFTIESAWESARPLPLVFAQFATVFVGGACFASAAFWVIERLAAEGIAPTLVSFVAVTATVATLPMLPSRGGTAATFTMDRLPEDETVGGRIEQAKALLVKRCGLTPREAEVFECMLQGCTHEEVSERLSISVWTARNHTRAIYAKTGAHSAKELMALVYKKPDR